MEETRLVGATAVIGGPVTFVVARNSPDRERWISTSEIVVEALLPALLSDSPVSVELVGSSNVIKRVDPYSTGSNHDPHGPVHYQVSRIATQRTPDGREEHLEVFLKEHNEPEKAFNVFDGLLKAMILAVFRNDSSHSSPEGRGFSAMVLDGDSIVSVTIGEA